MIHAPEVVEERQITNEIVGYRIVCCGEKCCLRVNGQGFRNTVGQCRPNEHICCQPDAHTCEDSWHTVSVHREDHASYIEGRKTEVAAQHEKMVQWRAASATQSTSNS